MRGIQEFLKRIKSMLDIKRYSSRGTRVSGAPDSIRLGGRLHSRRIAVLDEGDIGGIGHDEGRLAEAGNRLGVAVYGQGDGVGQPRDTAAPRVESVP